MNAKRIIIALAASLLCCWGIGQAARVGFARTLAEYAAVARRDNAATLVTKLASTLNPKNARAHANRGMIMLLRRQDVEAQKEFDAALKIDSSLRTDLEKSINQIIKTREQQPAMRSP